ncbi:MAG: CehA/McbA family metallohydrolase [Gemmataceae bacterium]
MSPRSTFLGGVVLFALLIPHFSTQSPAEDLPTFPVVKSVDLQPLGAQATRVMETLERLGSPLSLEDRQALAGARKNGDQARGVASIQEILDRRCLAAVTITGEGTGRKMTVQSGPAPRDLAEQGWRIFLVKVINPGSLEGWRLQAFSPNAAPLTRTSSSRPDPTVISSGEVSKRFLDFAMIDDQPLVPTLSGLEVEYRVVSVFCRDSGRKEASIGYRLVGPRKEKIESPLADQVFESIPAVLVKIQLKDEDGASRRDGRPIMGSFLFRDRQGRVYPSLARRLAPDFNFHPQIYRADGETVHLQPGTYNVSWSRGPEYLVQTRVIEVPAGKTHTESFTLKRWIHPAKKGWWSGDHHIHAAGCSHYESPTEGVTPEDMMRHILGEDLNVGCCLSWGPCWYHQKRYFSGQDHQLSLPSNILHYDVEVSGFPSSHCGHICLLRLKEQDYPGARVIEDWPSWDLPIFRWARKQGSVIGFAHTGWGLDVGPIKELPNYIVPPMNSIGANEYLVDVALDHCDFLSTVDTPSIWELNIWYHTLNCGYRCRISGETDFPCIYGERVGIGRSYVHLDGKLDFSGWVDGIKNGRCYVCDGKSHLMDFKVADLPVGTRGSEVRLDRPGTVQVTAKVAGLLEAAITPETEAIRGKRLDQKPYWDLERCRIGATRKVPVEVVVNGKAVARKEIEADGKETEVRFEVPIDQSSWVALRILPSSHTNPVFVVVDGKPIRTSRRSAQWCLDGIQRCWEQKKRAIRTSERATAEKAYDEARAAYRAILAESTEE